MADFQSALAPILGISGAALAAGIAHSLASGSEPESRAYSRTAVDLSAAFFGFELMRSSTLPVQPFHLSSAHWFDLSQPTTRIAIAALVLLLTLWIAKSNWSNSAVQKFIKRGGTASIVAVVTALLATDSLSPSRRKADLTLATHEALASLCAETAEGEASVADVLESLAALRLGADLASPSLIATTGEMSAKERRHDRWAARRAREGKSAQGPRTPAEPWTTSDLCNAVALYQSLVGSRAGAV